MLESQQSQSTTISNAISRIVADYVGRGPDTVRTTLQADMAVCVMRGTFTKAEQSFVVAGQGDFVREMRSRFQETMRADFEAAITEILGRSVLAFLSDHSVSPDIAVEVFILGDEVALA